MMIPVNSDFILEIAPHFSGEKAQAQTRIVGAISGVFAATLDSYELKFRCSNYALNSLKTVHPEGA
jgi:hypothetical protein